MPIIYRITNSITQKVYIGWSGNTLDKRWNEHIRDALKGGDNRKFYNAIRKYGTDCWHKEVLLEVNSKDEAKKKEIELIEEYNSYHQGYNATKGGDGNNGIVMSKESNDARSRSLEGKSKSPETVEKFKKRTHTEETKLTISKSHTGMKKPWVKWNKEQITSRAMTRRALTEEQHIKIKDLRKEGITNREISERLGIEYGIVKKWANRKWDL